MGSRPPGHSVGYDAFLSDASERLQVTEEVSPRSQITQIRIGVGGSARDDLGG